MFPRLIVLTWTGHQQIADILTKRSFSREKWVQLTHLFILMTPYLHTSISQFYFRPCKKNDAMSKRNAEPTKESATAKQRPVRSLFTYGKAGEGQQGRLLLTWNTHPRR